jgi:hypothetical protein
VKKVAPVAAKAGKVGLDLVNPFSECHELLELTILLGAGGIGLGATIAGAGTLAGPAAPVLWVEGGITVVVAEGGAATAAYHYNKSCL